MNNINITGNLTKDAELKYTNSGKMVINFSIANNDEYRKKDDGTYENIVSFVDCVYWPRTEKIVKHLFKGNAVTVHGRLKQDRWEKDGSTRSKIIINVTTVEPHHWKKEDEQPKQPKSTGFNPIDNNEDIPF